MIYIALPSPVSHRLPFYLAMEEYVARRLNDGDDCFFMWQVEPTVIFGRNQLIENEVNLDYCRRHGIATYRRKSGGGCVYADRSNVMFSYITRSDQVLFTFERYIAMVTAMLGKLGIAATTSGRNDIMIGGRKVSGNAFYHIPGHSIVHGTMLYDTDMRNMVGAITPSGEKLLSKGVESVRQHITLLKDHTTLTLEEFKQRARELLCDSETVLAEADLREIAETEQEYLTPAFIYGNNPRCTMVRRGRLEGVGELEVRMELKNNIIHSVDILGDYFVVGDVNALILQPLTGCELNRSRLEAALNDRLSDTILHLGKDQFINLLLGEQ